MAVQKASVAPSRQRVSLKRDNFSAGGVLPEGDYIVLRAQFIHFAYTTKDGNPTGTVTTAAQLILQSWVNGAAVGEELDQNWSVGSIESFSPSEDGNFLDAIGQRTSLSKQSNYWFLYDNMVNAGVPEELYDEQGIGMLVGMIGHITHIPAPDRTSLKQRSAVGTGVAAPAPEKKSDFPNTIPVFKTISSAPWDKKGGKTAPKPAAAAPKATTKVAPAAAPAPEPEESGDDSRLAGFIKTVMGTKTSAVRTKVRLDVHRAYNKAGIDAQERDNELKVFDDDLQLDTFLDTLGMQLTGDDSGTIAVQG